VIAAAKAGASDLFGRACLLTQHGFPGSVHISAKAPADILLTSLGAELRLVNRWSVAGRFDGEFAGGSQTYAGTGTVRYAW